MAVGSHSGPRYAPTIKPRYSLLGITPGLFMKWVPTLAVWGAGSGLFAAALFAQAIPKLREGIFMKTPLKWYYQDDVPEEDKPF